MDQGELKVKACGYVYHAIMSFFFRGNINKRRPYAAGEPCSGCPSNFPYCSHNTCSDSDSK